MNLDPFLNLTSIFIVQSDSGLNSLETCAKFSAEAKSQKEIYLIYENA